MAFNSMTNPLKMLRETILISADAPGEGKMSEFLRHYPVTNYREMEQHFLISEHSACVRQDLMTHYELCSS